MSHAYNARKKARRRKRFEENPEHLRVWKLIRAGALPRYFILKDKFDRPAFGKAYRVWNAFKGKWRRALHFSQKSTFLELTRRHYE